MVRTSQKETRSMTIIITHYSNEKLRLVGKSQEIVMPKVFPNMEVVDPPSL